MKNKLFNQGKATSSLDAPTSFPSIKIDGKKITKKATVSIVVFLIVSGLAVAALMAINSFFNTYYFEFRTPVIFQAPVLLHEREQALISPIPEVIDLHVAAAEVVEPAKPEIVLSKRAQECVTNYPEVAEKLAEAFGDEASTVIELVCRESSLNPKAVNKSSGAAGLFQAYPASKLKCELADVDCQIAWGKKYIQNRYGSAEAALLFHDKNNWY